MHSLTHTNLINQVQNSNINNKMDDDNNIPQGAVYMCSHTLSFCHSILTFLCIWDEDDRIFVWGDQVR